MGKQLFLPSSKIKVDETEIQGDVLVGLQKKAEIFAFFTISDASKFKQKLGPFAIKVATTKQARRYEQFHTGERVKVNIAFTAPGLTTLGAGGVDASDTSFQARMKKAPDLGDDIANDWLPDFRDKDFDGLLLIAAWDWDPDEAAAMAQDKLTSIVGDFGGALTVAHTELGKLNPAAPGHEVFGFADGVSQPAVKMLHRPEAAEDQSFPGQDLVGASHFVLRPAGNDGKDDEEDIDATPRPPAPWMENGSYLVFRRLRQDVDTFSSFVNSNFGGFADNAEQFGARLIGRWKDGTPVARDPLRPNPDHDETKPHENNDFEFGIPKVGQERCPFNAHIRRVYPRSDIQGGPENSEERRILRAGIAFDQSDSGKTDDMGLLFVCYQSSITDKFEFIQQKWANADHLDFDPAYPAAFGTKLPKMTGIDLIIGQGKKPRDADWTVDSSNTTTPPKKLTNVPNFVTATGGEYFFSPSISGLKALAAGTASAAVATSSANPKAKSGAKPKA